MAKKRRLSTTRNTDFNFYYTDSSRNTAKYLTDATANRNTANLTLLDYNDYIEKSGQDIIADADKNTNGDVYNSTIDTTSFAGKENDTFRIYGAPDKFVLDNRQQYNNCGVDSVLNVLVMAGLKKITNQNRIETSFTKQLWTLGLIDDDGVIGRFDRADGGSTPDDYREILSYYGINSTSYASDALAGGTGGESVSLENVAQAVKSGGAAILAVSSDLLWGASSSASTLDHAVTVTGVVYDSSDNLFGFYIHDTGLWMTRYISKEDLAKCTMSDYTNDSWKQSQGVFGTVVNDNIKSNLNNLNLYGSRYDNILNGNSGNNIIKGYNGNDTIYGMAGEDKLYGGNGNDYIDGGDNDDKIYGENGNDIVLGGLGADYIRGGNGHDKIDGGDGNDIIYGDGGNDIIVGGAGNDIIRGGSGNDWIFANEGVTIDSTLKIEDLKEEDAKNIIENSAQYLEGRNTIYGDAGNDHIFGGNDNDLIYGGNGKDYIYGGGGIDAIYGGSGDDTIYGGDGLDRISGDSGNDTLSGGLGDDVIICGSGNDKVIIGKNDGYDRVSSSSGSVTFETDDSPLNMDFDYNSLSNSIVVEYDMYNGFEYQGFYSSRNYLKYGNESYRMSATKSKGNIRVADKKSNNILYAFSDRNNNVTTSARNDIVWLKDGDNTITYTGGYDKYYSGSGDDNYVVNNFSSQTYLSINDSTTGDGDTVSLGDTLTINTDNFRLFFDIQKDGKTSLNNDNLYLIYSDNIISSDYAANILNDKVLGGVISITDYFKSDADIASGDYKGDGCIEKLKINGRDISSKISSAIDTIRQDVSKWLNDYNLIVTMIICRGLLLRQKVLLYGRLRHFPQNENEVIEKSGMPVY